MTLSTDLCVSPAISIRDALACIDRNQKGILLVVDLQGKLVDTLTDGDIRRAVLARLGLDTSIAEVLAQKSARRPAGPPVTAPIGTNHAALLGLMKEHSIRQVPLVSSDGELAALVTIDEVVPGEGLPIRALIMAGGLGTRLRPLTEHTPKPMLPVGDRPLIEMTLERLRNVGIRQVNISTCYRGDTISEHLGDGSRLGIELRYVTESSPLGTAGALGLLEDGDQPVLVINGDILTNIDFRSMLSFHREHDADLTVGVRRYELKVPFGVIESDGVHVRQLSEKPDVSFMVNAGVYLLQPEVKRHVSSGERMDMTDLIQRLLDAGSRVVSFPILEYWLDIGGPDDYVRAQNDFKNGLVNLQ